MTEIVEAPELVTTDDGDHDRFSHYFRKTDIEKAYLEGTPIRALCGKVDVPLRDPKKYPTCGTCKDIFENVVQP